jgi:hypothetical protein
MDEDHLKTYVNELYGMFPAVTTNLPLIWDSGTDNQAGAAPNTKYVPGEVRVPASGGDWSFSNIYNCNYFLDNVLPKYEANTVTGSKDYIRHYIGEAYFFRAYAYFAQYRYVGDYPVIDKVLPDDMTVLTEYSKRMPRNEVARFILSDLDKAVEFMAVSPDSRRTRVNRNLALLLKSRVALYEGTFLKYFKGTAFVPQGDGWPGAGKDYNKNYAYPSGSIDAEINFFLEQAMDAAQKVADAIPLTANTGLLQQDKDQPVNPYVDMFADVDCSQYSEVLLWHEFNLGQGVTHLGNFISTNINVGVTRGFTECFLMANGLPIYAAGSGYHGDDYIADVRKDRDNRLFLFLTEPLQKNILWESADAKYGTPTVGYPTITTRGTNQYNVTGYTLRKQNPWDAIHFSIGGGDGAYTGVVFYRGAEALLNYIEACYERYASLNAKAEQYWQAIRTRAKVDADFRKTIDATDMEKEKLDWGAYSGSQLLTDKTLYNIRRERRCEFIGEGMRALDLQRWRAMDQMIAEPYHIEGFKLWGPMQNWYPASTLVYGLSAAASVVSLPPSEGGSEYLRPFEINGGSLAINGYRWAMAHYLSPIATKHVQVTAVNGDIATSPIYQNPGWSWETGSGASE